eukprot:GHVU01087341.1.p1 GENE.GHVU01087341.1~~GHVU01087341.1.p1  ORF type:complete len:175 (-),score=20.64 GHVU01087341.1:392-916(-)
MQEGDSTLTTTKFMNAGARPFRFIMGASPQFEMGKQMLILTDCLCRKQSADQVTNPARGVTHFKIDGYDVTATTKYRFDEKALTGGDNLIPKSFSSHINCSKFYKTREQVQSKAYTLLGLEDPHSTVERSGLPSEPSRPEETWYKELQEDFAKRPPPQELYNFDELWEIDAEFR